MNRVINLFFLVLLTMVMAAPDAISQTTPSRQASRISMTTAGGNTTFNWRAGDGANEAVFICPTSTISVSPWDAADLPVDNATYNANTAYGSGTQVGDAYCVFNAAAGTNTVTVTGLTAGTQYTVFVVEYNGGAGSEMYLTGTRTTNPATFTAPADPLVVSHVTNQHIAKLSWTGRPAGSDVVIQVATDAAFTTLVSGYQWLNVGQNDSWVLFGLDGGTQYHYRAAYIQNGAMSNWDSDNFTTDAETNPTITGITSNVGADGTVVNHTTASANGGYSDVSSNPYYVDIEFSEIMDWSVEPTVLFDVAGDNTRPTNTITMGTGEWIPVDDDANFPFETTWRQYFTFTVATPDEYPAELLVDITANTPVDMDPDAGIPTADVDDNAGDLFFVDTKVPVIAAASITGDICLTEADDLLVSVQATDAGYGDLDRPSFDFGTTDPIVNNADLNTNRTNPGAGDDVTITSTAAIAAGDLSDTYTFDYSVTDPAGNETANTIAFTIDKSDPTAEVAITSGECNDGTGTVVFTVSVTDPSNCGTWSDGNIALGGTASTTPMLNWGTLAANPGNPISGDGEVGTPYVFEYTLTLAAGDNNGDYTITATPTDPAGNAGVASAAATFTIDENDPIVNSVTIERLADNSNDQNISGDGAATADLRVTVRVTDTGECGDFGDDVVAQTGAAQLLFTKTAGTGTCTDMLGNGGDAIAALQSATETGAGTNVWDLVYEFDVDGETEGDIDFSVQAIDRHANSAAANDVAVSLINIDNTDPSFTVHPTLNNDPGSACYDAGDASVEIDMTIDETAVIEAGGLGNLTNANISVTNVSGPQTLTWVKAGMGGGDGGWTQTITSDVSGTDATYTGDYVIEVVATDEAGNTVTSNTETFSIDNTAPVIENLWFTSDIAGTTTITCADPDNNPTVYMWVQIQDPDCGTVADGSVTVVEDFAGAAVYAAISGDGADGTEYVLRYDVDISGDPSGEYNVTVDADDSKGNSAVQYAPANAEFTIDDTDPSVIGPTITDVVDCYKDGSTMTLSVTASDAGGCGSFDASNVVVWFDQNTNGTYDGAPDLLISNVSGAGPTYTYTYTMTGTETGNIYALATDNAGNSNTPASGFGILANTEYEVDNTAPTAAITFVDACLNNTQTLTADILVTEAGTCGLSGYTATVTGVGKGTADPVLAAGPTDNGNGTYSLQYTVDLSQATAYAEGTYTFSFTTNDAAGNPMAAPQTDNFVVENTKQTISAISFTDECVNNANDVAFSFTIDDTDCAGDPNEYNTPVLNNVSGVGAFAAGSVDGAGPYTFNYTLDVADKAEGGPYTFTVDYTDDFGNASDQITGTYYVDNSVPVITGIVLDKSCVNGTGSVKATVTVTENSTCGLDLTTAAPVASGGLIPVLNNGESSLVGSPYTFVYDIAINDAAEGAYTFDFDIDDVAGNSAADVAAENFNVDKTAPTIDAGVLAAIDEGCVKTGDVVVMAVDFSDATACGTLNATHFTVSLTDGTATVTEGASLVVGDVDANTISVTYTVGAGDLAEDTDIRLDVSVTDDAGNTATAFNAAVMHIDRSKPTLGTPVLAALEPTCVNAGEEVVIEVPLTDASTNCSTFDNTQVAVTLTGQGALDNAPTVDAALTNGNIVIRYTVGGTETDGAVTVTSVTYTDPAGNVSDAVSAASLFTFDVTDPDVNENSLAFANDGIGGTCYGDARDIEFTFSVVETGCGTFDNPDNITVTITDAGANPYTATYSGRTGTGTGGDPYVFTYTYTFLGTETNGVATVTVDLVDDAGNDPVAEVMTTNFTIDNAAPTVTVAINELASCFTNTDVVDFTVTVADATAACGTIDQNDVVVTMLDANSDPVATAFVNEAPAGTLNYTATVGANETGDVSVNVVLKDDAQNEATDSDAAFFTIDNTAPEVTSFQILDGGNPVTCIVPGTYTLRVAVTETGCGEMDGAIGTGPGDIAFTTFLNAPNLTFDSEVSGDGTNYVYDYNITVIAADAGPQSVVARAYDSKSNEGALYNPTGAEFTVDVPAHTVALGVTTDPVSTCIGTGTVITADVTVDADELACTPVSAVDAYISFDGGAAVAMTADGGNPAVNADGVHTFTYTVAGTEDDGNVVITAYVNKDATSEVTDTDNSLTIDNTPATLTPKVFASACVNTSVDLHDITIDDATNCVDIDASSITVELYTAGDAWTKTLTSAAPNGATTFTYDQGLNLFDLTYTVQGNEPQNEAIGVRIAVEDKAGNITNAVVVDADAFSIDYTAPTLALSSVTKACLRSTDQLEFVFTVTDGECNDGLNAISYTDPSVANSVAGVPAGLGPWTVTATLDISDVAEGAQTIDIDYMDDAGNAATTLTVDFYVDDTAPVVTNITDNGAVCVKDGDVVTINFDVDADDCGTFDKTKITSIALDDNNVTTYTAQAADITVTEDLVNGGWDVAATITLPNGSTEDSYDIDIVLADDAGNTTNESALAELEIDNTAPTLNTLNITDACLNPTQTLEFSFVVTDAECATGINGLSFTDPSTNANVQTDIVGGGPWTVSATLELTDVTEGAHTVTVNYMDDAGNAATQLDVDFNVRTTLPTVDLLAVTDACDNSTIDYSFEITDNACAGGLNNATVTDDNGYNQSVAYNAGNGNYSGSIDVSAYGDGQYTLTVTYTDDAGLEGTDNITFNVDRTAPVIANLADDVTCVKDGDLVTITFDVTENGCDTFDKTNITTLELNDNATHVYAVDPSNITVAGNANDGWNVTATLTIPNSATEGLYDVNLAINDDAGNTDTDAIVGALTIDNTAPTVNNYTIANSCVSGLLSFDFDVTDGTGCGFASAEFYVNSSVNPDATFIADGGNPAGNTYTYTKDVSGDDDGPYDLMIRVYDAAGNYTDYNPSGDATAEYSVDNNPATISDITLVDGSCVDDVVTFEFTVTDEGCGTLNTPVIGETSTNDPVAVVGYPMGSTFRYTLDVSDLTSAGNPHTITVDYTDDANQDAVQKTVDFNIDRAAPAITAVTASHTCVNANTVDVQIIVDADDIGCAGLVQDDITVTVTGLTTTATSAAGTDLNGDYLFDVTIDALDQGSYDVVVAMQDQLGNALAPNHTEAGLLVVDNEGPVVDNHNVNLACVNDGDNVVFTVDIEATGCASTIQTVTPSLLPATGTLTGNILQLATTNVGNVYTYSYQYQIQAADPTTLVDIAFEVTDNLGNVTNYNPADAYDFNIDNAAPVVNGFVLNEAGQECFVGNNTAATFEVIDFDVTITDAGCGNIVNDIAVVEARVANTTTLLNGTIAIVGVSGDTYSYSYTPDNTDPTGLVDLAFVISDDLTNESTEYLVEDAFSIDNDDPTAINMAVTDDCLAEGTTTTISFDIDDLGCSNELTVANVDVAFSPALNNALANAQVVNGTYSADYTVHANDPSSGINITATITDEAGNEYVYSPAGAEFTIDNTAPVLSAITPTPVVCIKNDYAGDIVVEFEVVEEGCGTFDALDNITVTGLEAIDNDPVINITGIGSAADPYVCTYTFDLTAAAVDGSYTATVNVSDDAGNTAGPETHTFTIDREAPVLSNFNITEATCTNGAPLLTMTFNVVDLDQCGDGIGDNEITINGLTNLTNEPTYVSRTGSGTSLDPWLFTYTLQLEAGDPSGNYDVVIIAVDGAQNLSTALNPAGHEFSIDHTAPTVDVVYNGSECVMEGNQLTFTVTIGDGFTCDGNPLTNEDVNVAVTGANGTLSTANDLGNGVYEYTYTVHTDDSGNYTITATVTDDAGNSDNDAVVDAFYVDDQAPTVAFGSVTQNACAKAADVVEFTFTVTEAGCIPPTLNDISATVTLPSANIENAVVTGTYPNYTATYEVTLNDGTGTADINISVQDQAGNTSTYDAISTFEVDNSAPVLSNYSADITCAKAGQTITFGFDVVNDGCATYDAALWDAVTAPNGFTINATPALTGNFTALGMNGNVMEFQYTVQATDPSGSVQLYFDLYDSKGMFGELNVPTAFNLDTEVPVLNLTYTGVTCVNEGTMLTFNLEASDNDGCGVGFDENNIVVNIPGAAGILGDVTPVVGMPNNYTFTYTVNATDAGNYDVTVDATDAAGNTAIQESLIAAFFVDNTAPLVDNFAVTQNSCASANDATPVLFTFDATEAGCGDAVPLNVTIDLPNSSTVNATLVSGTGNNGAFVYSYTVGTNDGTGSTTVHVEAMDAAGNSQTYNFAGFEIDNSAPVISNYADDQTCVKSAETINFSVDVEDLGCGTFVQNDITINIITESGNPLLGNITPNGNVGNTYNYTYTVNENDPTGTVNLTFDLQDSKGNMAVQLDPAGDEFSIDNNAPQVANLFAAPYNAKDGDIVNIEFDATDLGCGSLGTPLVDLTFADNSTTTATYFSGPDANGLFVYRYTVTAATPEGGVNIAVTVNDGVLNQTILDPANPEFTIISTTPANVTSVVVNDNMILDSEVGNNFTVAVTYDQVMDTDPVKAPAIAFSPDVSATFINGTGAWSNGNQTYTMTYVIADAQLCETDVDVHVTGGENTVGIAANNGMEANLFSVSMCPAANARSDIQFNGNEAVSISSLSTGAINASTDGTEVLKITVRDDITTDSDTKPTSVTSMVINAAAGNTAQFDTYLESAALFDGTGTKLGDATIAASTLTFNGLTVSCADDATFDMYLRVALKTSIPNGDGLRFVFNLTDAGVTQDVNSTMFTTFNLTSSSSATYNQIQVIATQLAFVAQPTSSTVGTVADDVTVKAQDANGNVDQDATQSVSLTITNTTTIETGSSANLVAGLATFNNLTYGYPESNAVLTASIISSSITAASSNSFLIQPAVPAQISSLTYLGRTKYSITFNWSAPSKSLVIAEQGSAISVVQDPVNGQTYTPNSDFSLATDMIGSAKVVYYGSATTLTVSGLSKSTTYTFKVYSFDANASFDPATIVYNTTGAPTLTRQTSRFKEEAGADVELRSFDVTSADAQAFLDWETIRETDNVGFEVHRAEMTEAGLEPFEMIASYEDNASLQGLNQSEFGKRYKLTDEDAALNIGANYVYRLVSVASDGYKAVQAEQSVKINGAASMTVSDIKPNPVVTDLAFDLDMDEAREITIQIYSIEGTMVAQPILTKEYSMGLHKVKIDLDRAMIPAGTYTLKVIAGDNEVVSKRFVVVR